VKHGGRFDAIRTSPLDAEVAEGLACEVIDAEAVFEPGVIRV